MTGAGPTEGAPEPYRPRSHRRLLVALLLEGRVEAEVDALRKAVTPRPSPLAPHLTLVPPVNVAEEDLGAAMAVVREAAAGAAPLGLELGPTGLFARRRSVLFLSVGGDLPGLEALREACSRPPLETPATREPRPFVPHVTLSSNLERHRASQLTELLATYRTSVTCTSLSLLAEQHEPAGRRWAVVANEVLGGRAVRGRGGLELSISLSDRLDPEAGALVEEEWAAYHRAALGLSWQPGQPFVLVARHDGQVVGVASGTRQGGTCELSRLLVVAPARGLGIGGRLLEAVERYAGDEGCARVRLRTLEEDRATGFCERRGYAPVARLAGAGEGADLVVMERRIG